MGKERTQRFDSRSRTKRHGKSDRRAWSRRICCRNIDSSHNSHLHTKAREQSTVHTRYGHLCFDEQYLVTCEDPHFLRDKKQRSRQRQENKNDNCRQDDTQCVIWALIFRTSFLIYLLNPWISLGIVMRGDSRSNCQCGSITHTQASVYFTHICDIYSVQKRFGENCLFWDTKSKQWISVTKVSCFSIRISIVWHCRVLTHVEKSCICRRGIEEGMISIF